MYTIPFQLQVSNLTYDVEAGATFINNTETIVNIVFNATCYTPETGITRSLYLCIPSKNLLGDVVEDRYIAKEHPALPQLKDTEINVQVFRMSGKKKQNLGSDVVVAVRDEFVNALANMFKDKLRVHGLHRALQFCEYQRRADSARLAHDRYKLLEDLKIDED